MAGGSMCEPTAHCTVVMLRVLYVVPNSRWLLLRYEIRRPKFMACDTLPLKFSRMRC
jgi:hypothetical protein